MSSQFHLDEHRTISTREKHLGNKAEECYIQLRVLQGREKLGARIAA